MHLQNVPGAVSKWEVGLVETILLYLITITIIQWFQTKRFYFVLQVLFCLLIYSGWEIVFG